MRHILNHPEFKEELLKSMFGEDLYVYLDCIHMVQDYFDSVEEPTVVRVDGSLMTFNLYNRGLRYSMASCMGEHMLGMYLLLVPGEWLPRMGGISSQLNQYFNAINPFDCLRSG